MSQQRNGHGYRKQPHMNPGDGESSYASNSSLQETVIQKALPVLKHTIKSMSSHDSFSGQCLKIADLGCSSSKNTLLVASNIIRIVIEACKENNRKPPQFEVPEGLESNALNIYMAKTSPPNVFQAYGKKFKSDFTKFLQMRSKELVCGGRMVLTFVGRPRVMMVVLCGSYLRNHCLTWSTSYRGVWEGMELDDQCVNEIELCKDLYHKEQYQVAFPVPILFCSLIVQLLLELQHNM
ncbi:hypothetical protein L1987_28508 [Smallanthus sonchifolius]|uniref:Uncharacterized protein n=1 Tax=Smallanthus sonchifolius TaxID=185202 RepID=A0ACB9HXX4_9ASTR|nr:hypothetical protein L1987_28508 [Smallanthus sonchifolius]